MLPDVRDGLDVRSRDCLSRVGDTYVRSSKVVDDDSAYAALVRLAQEFAQRYPLVDGRGNFGSIDGDPPADAIYTEVRRTPLGRELERFPNLLVNGSGTIPSHNLGEVAGAVLAVLDDPAIDVDGLMRFLPGPDFPSGGVLVDAGAIRAAYATGSGELRLRARARFEDRRIVLTELPFGVEKGGDDGIIRAIVEGLHARTLLGIDDLQDHTDREGMRVLIGLAPGAEALDVLQRLFASTALEVTFTVDLVARVGASTERFTLRTLIDAFLDGRDPDAVRRELPELARRHGDARRTSIVGG